jgi:hypothetical protein
MSLRYCAIVALLSLAACELFPTATGSCQGPMAVTAPDTVVAEAFHNDCGGPSDVDGDVYQFTLLAQNDLLFRMEPTGFRGSMGLYRGVYGDRNPKLVFEVLGPGSATFGARAYLPNGQYFLMAGPAGRSGGEYGVAFTPTSAADCSVFDWTTVGSTITGSVTTADCGAGTGLGGVPLHQDTYYIWLSAGESIRIAGIAGAKPFELQFRKQSDAAEDNIEEQTLAAGATTAFTFTATSKGAYGIHAVSSPAAIGAVGYTIQVGTPP